MIKITLLTAACLFIAGSVTAQTIRSYNPQGYTEVDMFAGTWTNRTSDGRTVSETNNEFFSTVYHPVTGAVAFYIRPTANGVEFLDVNKKVGMVALDDSDRAVCYDEAFCEMVEALSGNDEDDEDWR